MNTYNFNPHDIRTKLSDVTADAQWRLVKQTATGVVLTSAGNKAYGVSRYDIVAGSACSVITAGDIPGIASSDIPAGAEVCSAANGKLIDIADAASGAIVVGVLTNGTFATADGDEVVFTFYGIGQYAKP